MKKVGIVTFHGADNYGAILQCVALRQVIRDLGYNSYVINHINTAIEDHYKIDTHSIISGIRVKPFKTLFSIPIRILWILSCNKRHRQFKNDIEKYCEPKNYRDMVPDDMVFGSDQIWNCYITNNDLYYYGLVEDSFKGRKVAYSASLGFGNPEFLSQNKEYLSEFHKISVREIPLKNHLSRLGFDVEITLDPTLLIDSKKWDNLLGLKSKDHNPYLLVYAIRNKKTTLDFAKKVAKTKGLRVVSICSKETFTTDEIFNFSGGYASIKGFVNLFKNANVVITDSFHGTAFSLIYHKPFLSMRLNNPGDSRQESILRLLGMLSHFVDPKTCSIDIPIEQDYSEKLKSLQKSSIQYLNGALK